MKALVKFKAGPGNMEVQEVEAPVVEDGEVLVKMHAAGFCGTDMEIYRWEFKTRIPVIMGHEGAGEVIEVGRGVTGIKAGDRVALETSKIACGSCYYCRIGRYNLCPDRKGMGYGTDGTFAEYLKTDARRAQKIPETISYEEASILEPLSVAVRAGIEIGRVRGGDTVLISGPGPIGLFLLQVVKAAGASSVIMVGRKNQARLDLARELGATHIFRHGQDDVSSRILQITGGMGVDSFFECTGNSGVFLELLKGVRKGGQIVLVGLYPEEVRMGLNQIVTNELEIKGTWTSGVFTDWTRTIAMVESGQIKVRPLISHRFPLGDWRKVVQLMEAGACIKSVFTLA